MVSIQLYLYSLDSNLFLNTVKTGMIIIVSDLLMFFKLVVAIDPRVMYSEPAKFVAKLREMKTDNNLLLFKCELGAGHFSKSGRYERT